MASCSAGLAWCTGCGDADTDGSVYHGTGPVELAHGVVLTTHTVTVPGKPLERPTFVVEASTDLDVMGLLEVTRAMMDVALLAFEDLGA